MRGAGEDTAEPEALRWRHREFSARLVEALLRADQALSRFTSGIGIDLPGLSWWAVCRRSF